MKQVYIARNPADAHLLAGILEEYGISCDVRGEELWTALGALPVTPGTQPAVWIRDDNRYEEAEKLVWQYQNKTLTANTVDGPWKCPKCGEELEAQYTECWQCGSSRPTQTQD